MMGCNIQATGNKKCKVVVIGAGLAGLTTAYRLQQKGIDVEIYEARSRVGGRVLSVNIGGNVAELGAQSIADGGDAKNLYSLIQELSLEVEESKINLNRLYFTGKELIEVNQLLSRKKLDSQALRIQLDALASKSKNMRDVLSGILQEEDPLYKVMAVRLAGYEGASVEKLSPVYIKTLYYMLLGGSCAVYQKSGDEQQDVHLLSIKGGNSLLPEKIAKVLSDRLYFNKILVRVAKDADDSFVLTFSDNQKLNADKLVLAIPCSMYDQIVFEDNVIPVERVDFIKSVQYGTNAKILIPCELSSISKNRLMNDRIGTFYDKTHKVLTLYYTGAASVFSSDSIIDTYNQDKPMIEMGLENEYPLSVLPVFAQDKAFVRYDEAVGYSWPNDPYAKGSFSYISPGQEGLLTALQEENGEMVKVLFAPINQKLYFAGEHTSILMDVPGTMEAACESGERIARMILNGI